MQFLGFNAFRSHCPLMCPFLVMQVSVEMSINHGPDPGSPCRPTGPIKQGHCLGGQGSSPFRQAPRGWVGRKSTCGRTVPKAPVTPALCAFQVLSPASGEPILPHEHGWTPDDGPGRDKKGCFWSLIPSDVTWFGGLVPPG